jgi:hypothetical protein
MIDLNALYALKITQVDTKTIYNRLVDELSLKQYVKLIGGVMSYTDKAKRAKKVSKSKKVHTLADIILSLDSMDSLQRFMLNKRLRNTAA